MTKRFSKITAVFLLVVTVFALMCTSAFAATSGSTGSRTIYVTTKSDWTYLGTESITLKQSPVTVKYTGFFNAKKTTTRTYYPVYNITVRNTATGATKSYTFNSATKKIKLDRDASYTITVAYDRDRSFLRVPYPAFWIYQSESKPYWWVDSACKAVYR